MTSFAWKWDSFWIGQIREIEIIDARWRDFESNTGSYWKSMRESESMFSTASMRMTFVRCEMSRIVKMQNTATHTPDVLPDGIGTLTVGTLFCVHKCFIVYRRTLGSCWNADASRASVLNLSSIVINEVFFAQTTHFRLKENLRMEIDLIKHPITLEEVSKSTPHFYCSIVREYFLKSFQFPFPFIVSID